MNASTKKTRITRAVQTESKRARELALSIHGWAERPFRETKSSQAIASYLESHGFRIEFPFKKIPTAFRATWGKGKPAIGLLGEYDALPNCGSKEGVWGHG
ncbi:MAG: hypothetical protein O2954_01200 [bacterium]|nr:hypothetical protein [bacterium]